MNRRYKLILIGVVIMTITMLISFAEPYTVKYDVNKMKINEGDSFTLTIELSKGLDSARSYTLVNKSTDKFTLKTGATKQPFEASSSNKGEVGLIYNGGGNNFSFEVIDNDGTVVINDAISIKEVVVKDNKDDSSSTPPDTSKLEPQLEVINNPLNGEFTTDKLYTPIVKIENTTMNTAKNVTATIVKGSDDLPFIMSESTIKSSVDRISKGKPGGLDFKIKIDPTADSKTYSLMLKLSYQNRRDASFSKEVPFYLKVDNQERRPLVGIVETRIEGGYLSTTEAKKVAIVLTNAGTLNAENIQVELTGLTSDTVRIHKDLTSKYVGGMATNQTANLEYNLIASTKASGTQTVTAKIKYNDESGNAYEREVPVYIEAQDAVKTINQLSVKLGRTQYHLSPGGVATVTGTITNNATSPINDLKATLSTEGTIKFMSPYIEIVDTLKAGESQTLSFKITAEKGAAPNTYPLYLTVKPVSSADESAQKMDVSGVTITSEESTSKPKVIIDSYDYGGNFVLAGTAFPLKVKFKNTSSSLGIRNLKASFKSSDGTFIPVESSNSFFIKNINPGEVVEATVRIKTKNDTAPKVYPLNFTMEYEDSNGKSYDAKDNPYKEEESISINIKQENKLQVGEFTVPTPAFVGNPIRLDVNFFNMGKSTMYNLLVSMKGDFDTRDSDYFVGSFEPGKSDFYSGTIVPTKEGENTGDIIFSFEDANGEKMEIKHPLKFNVDAQMVPPEGGDENHPGGDMMPPDGEFPNEQAGGFKLPIWVWFILAGVIVAIVAIVIVRRRKKAHMASLMEDMDETE